MPPPEVNAVTVKPRDIPIQLEYVGQTEGMRDAEVRPRVSGILRALELHRGQPACGPARACSPSTPRRYQVLVQRADADLATATRADSGRA